jgi:hypothetical protein
MWMCWLPAPLERQTFRPDLDLTVVVQLGITFLDGLRQFFSLSWVVTPFLILGNKKPAGFAHTA